MGFEPAEICFLAGGCTVCPNDPGRQECVHLFIRNMRADEKIDPIVPIATVTARDLGGTATEHTVELTLIHPEFGDPVDGESIRVLVDDGNATFLDGTTVKVVTTGADGTATVILTDLDGGSNELDLYVDSAVPYLWVKSTIYVIFQ